MQRGSEWLSVGAEVLAAEEDNHPNAPPAFDILIVGSGYGAAVAARRIAEWARESQRPKPPSIGMLERGLEYQPGDFPKTMEELTAHVRISGGDRSGIRGWRDGLFDLRIGEDVSALVANGLGGGSLINAGVAEKADAKTLSDPAWPRPWRADLDRWEDLYSLAETELCAKKWPQPEVRKAQAMQALATHLKGQLKDVALTIEPPSNVKGTTAGAAACERCGNCFSGCNVGAKRTLGTTYLKAARELDVHIFTGATVLDLVRGTAEFPWRVHWVFSDPKRLPRRSKPYSIMARRVILAAGTFGSTEILLKSQGPGLRFSGHLGSHFSSNADVIGAQYGLPGEVQGWAHEGASAGDPLAGPTITHMIKINRGNATTPEKRVVVQDLAVPAPLEWLFEELLTSVMIPQRWTRFNWRTSGASTPDHAVVDPAQLDRTLLVAALGHDGAAGRLELLPGFDKSQHDGNLTIRWRQAAYAPCFGHIDKLMLNATKRIKGAYWLRNPMWQAVPDSPLIDSSTDRQIFTVHPLGGCRMAGTLKDGVVDPFGRVFDAGGQDPGGAPGRVGAEWAAREDRRIHQGLYVLDGSIIPTSLGINPLLTISALAEGVVPEWLREWSLEEQIHWREPPAQLTRSRAAKGDTPVARQSRGLTPVKAEGSTRLQFNERMNGFVVTDADERSSAQAQIRISMKFTFDPIEDLRAFTRTNQKSLNFTARVDLERVTLDPTTDRLVKTPNGHKPVVVQGEVKWFSRRCSIFPLRIWKAFWAWRDLRAAADLPKIDVQGRPVRTDWLKALGKVWPFVKTLSHFGEPRFLEYSFEPLNEPLTADFGDCAASYPVGTVFRGEKALVYAPAGNPWVQLTEMSLENLSEGQRLVARLRYDEIYMMSRDQLPLELRAQRDGVTGLRDVLSLALFFGRVLFEQHFLTFRKPDYSLPRPWRRLPYDDRRSRYADLEFTTYDDVVVKAPVARCGPIPLRLTRIRLSVAQGRNPGHPVLLLHGFGSGGIQFTHESIRNPMAQWLARKGREVWVGEMRTSIGLPTCEEQWVMDDIATEDIPVLVNAVKDKIHQERGTPADDRIDIIAHCIGSAMFCMAALTQKLDEQTKVVQSTLHNAIRRVVLMQVGPIIHLPRGNRMRGYVGNRAQKLLGLGMVKATIDADATGSEVAVDRILSTFPYMGGWDRTKVQQRVRDHDPGLKLSGDLRHNGRLVNAMRSAGVFAQLFQWNNLYDEKGGKNQPLLDALPDLLGACNLTTYQQTIQYAFLRRLTNQDGDSPYVTDPNIRAGLAMPILFVQGGLNDVFAPRGTLESQHLLNEVLGPGHTCERLVLGKYGHLDCVIGNTAAQDVFEPMLAFLDGNFNQSVSIRPAQSRPKYRRPSIGPWLGDAVTVCDGSVEVSLGLKVDEQRNPPAHIYTVLARRNGTPIAETLTEHATSATSASVIPVITRAQTRLVAAFWPEGEAVVRVRVPPDLQGEDLEVWTCTVLNVPPQGSTKASDFVGHWAEQCGRGGHQQSGISSSSTELPDGMVLLEANWIRTQATGAGIKFAVMSCRQAPLLVDRSVADEGFDQLRAHLDGLSHVLMIGDQIYADALAASEGVEGTRLRFFDAYREAWTAPHQRELMAKRPVYMAADDHEFRDDHSNATRLENSGEWRAAASAMWRYEYAAGPAGNPNAGIFQRKLWYETEHAGFSTFVCDTRNRRFDGDTVDCADSFIMSDRQLDDIRNWLQVTRPSGRPRFLVMPTPIAPVFKTSVLRPEYRLRSDNWLRYPVSLEKLFSLLVEDGGNALLVIGGDYHCFHYCEIEIADGTGRSARFANVTCPGIYSPYTFANTDPGEFWAPQAQSSVLKLGDFRWSYRELQPARAVSGYVQVEANAGGEISVRLVDHHFCDDVRPSGRTSAVSPVLLSKGPAVETDDLEVPATA